MSPGSGNTKRQVTHQTSSEIQYLQSCDIHHLNISSLQVPQDLIKALMKSVQKLLTGLHLSQAPEIIAFLRLLGNEVGYMKASELRQIVQTLFMPYHEFIPPLTAQVGQNLFYTEMS